METSPTASLPEDVESDGEHALQKQNLKEYVRLQMRPFRPTGPVTTSPMGAWMYGSCERVKVVTACKNVRGF